MRPPMHTPGPWTTGCGKNNTIAIVAREWETRLVANVSAKDRSVEETDANADLIAAAPDMLEALSELADAAGVFDRALHAGIELPVLSSEQSRLYNAVNKARAALHKARFLSADAADDGEDLAEAEMREMGETRVSMDDDAIPL